MSHARFVHLHVHSQYSLLQGACKISNLIKRAVDEKFPAIAITDQGNMFGTLVFYKEAIKQGIKPIIGLEAFLAPKSRFIKESYGRKGFTYQVVLFAKNEKGYRNLIKLSSIGYLDGFYYRPRIDKEVLAEYASDLICVSDCLRGEVSHLIQNDQLDEAEKVIHEYQEMFGKENFYLELQNHGLREQEIVREPLAMLSQKTGARLVATNNVFYVDKKDANAHDILLCIGSGSVVSDTKRQRFSTDEFYLKGEKEMKEIFRSYPDALQATLDIADQCNVEFDFSKTHLPPFNPPKGHDLESYLVELCEKGLKEKLKTDVIPQEYLERLAFEVDVIKKMGYLSYFLIVWDFIKYAKDHGIFVGPGRGSAAGSIVSFGLDITTVDPIKYGLLFERFLNPDRVSMPDIDIDFCYERRQEAIDYVERKYGSDNVAQIITFGTMAGRMAIRDVGRALAMSYGEVDQIAKLIPFGPGITIEKALQQEPRLKALVKKDERVKQLIEIAKSVEGLSRHAGTHAAGVVISDKPLTEYVPLAKNGDQVTTQFTMKDLEEIGLLKMDFLGLKTLTVIGNALEIIKKTKGEEIDIDSLEMVDEKTYELFASGNTTGIFQLESSGMRDLIRKLKPKNIEEVADLLALYRPGPLDSGMVDQYVKNTKHPDGVTYEHKLLEPILKETKGVILYQEQVMTIARDFAGFTLAQADNMRRAMGKKKMDILEGLKKDFVAGAEKKGVKKSLAEKIFLTIEKFGRYGFNKSHSVAYSFISYQTAFLKANYPLEFMTALLTSEKDNTDKIVQYIDEARRLKIKVMPPSVNESFYAFTASDDGIRFGLSAIKGVGTTAIHSIIENRKKEGKFKSIFHFVECVDLRLVNRKVMESLIKSGSFDEFEFKRSQLMAIVDDLLDFGNQIQKDRNAGQFGLFDGASEDEKYASFIDRMPDIEEWPESQLLENEKNTLGFYVTSHPLAQYAKTLKVYTSANSDNLTDFVDQQEVTIGGIIDSMRQLTTKKGSLMAFLSLEDLNGKVDVIVFPDSFQKNQMLLEEGKMIFIRGNVNAKEEVPKIIAEEVIPLEQVKNKLTKVVTIDLKTTGLETDTLEKLKELLQQYPGEIPVDLNFVDSKGRNKRLQTSPDFGISPSDEAFHAIESLVGVKSINIRL